MKNMAHDTLKVGLFGIGLNAYWPQFAGLEPRLRGYVDRVAEKLARPGVEIVNLGLIDDPEKAMDAGHQFRAADVDLIYFGGYHPEGGLLSRQLADAGVKAVIVGGEGLSNTEFWAIGGNTAAGTLFTNATDALKNPDSAAAVAALKEKGIPPEAFTLNAYAAVEVLKAAIEKAGKPSDATGTAKALKDGLQVKTAIGTLAYDKSGDLSSPSFSMFKWDGGKIVAAD